MGEAKLHPCNSEIVLKGLLTCAGWLPVIHGNLGRKTLYVKGELFFRRELCPGILFQMSNNHKPLAAITLAKGTAQVIVILVMFLGGLDCQRESHLP